MKKGVKIIGIALLLALVAFLAYRFIYTWNTGPTDEQLRQEKQKDDEVVAPAKLDALDKMVSEEDSSTTTDSIH
jgi:hypothetical protein